MPSKKKGFKTTKKEKEWFAERCGELLVKTFKKNISQVYDEAIEHHDLAANAENRKRIRDAYKTANPGGRQYAAKTYDPIYERGAAKNGEEKRRIFGYTAIDREVSLKAVRDAIVKAFESGDISSLDPKLIDIFKYGEHTPEEKPTTEQSEHTPAERRSFMDRVKELGYGEDDAGKPNPTGTSPDAENFVDILERTASGTKKSE